MACARAELGNAPPLFTIWHSAIIFPKLIHRFVGRIFVIDFDSANTCQASMSFRRFSN